MLPTLIFLHDNNINIYNNCVLGWWMFSQGCRSSRFTFNATVLAQGIHRSPRKMSNRCGPSAMQNDREREAEREVEGERKKERKRDTHTQSGWLIKKCSDCITWLLSWKPHNFGFFIYFHWLKMAPGHIKATPNTFLLFQKLISV